MNLKSYLLGILTGIALTIVVIFIGALFAGNSSNAEPIQYLERSECYENKTEASFQVFQVMGNKALASEASHEIGGDVFYGGNTVLILGENFYSHQVVTIKNPQRIGTYSYTNNGGMPMTVPVIDGRQNR